MNYIIERYGYRYQIGVEDEIMEDRYRAGELCEQQMLDWIVANVPSGGIWIDAGANIGNHALVFATACRADLVLAIEPVPVNYRLLDGNCRGYSNILPLRVGVGAAAALVGAVPGGTGKNCQWTLDATAARPDIAVLAIDNIIPAGAHVRLVKLDVEGMEEAALQGMTIILEHRKPELFVEIWDASVLVRITAFLARYGYTLIERWNHAPTYHYSASGRYPVTYKPPV